MELTHTDLKLENILLLDDSYTPQKRGSSREFNRPNSAVVRLIDFGGATFAKQHHSRIVNTRQYRAVEVILGLEWSYPSDIWSSGCILAELCTGELLFGTHSDEEHLALMQKILETDLPTQMVAKALRVAESREKRQRQTRDHDEIQAVTDLFHPRRLRLEWPECAKSKSSRKYVEKTPMLRSLPKLSRYPELQNLIHGCLTYDPDKRLTADKALQHKFFSMKFRPP